MISFSVIQRLLPILYVIFFLVPGQLAHASELNTLDGDLSQLQSIDPAIRVKASDDIKTILSQIEDKVIEIAKENITSTNRNNIDIAKNAVLLLRNFHTLKTINFLIDNINFSISMPEPNTPMAVLREIWYNRPCMQVLIEIGQPALNPLLDRITIENTVSDKYIIEVAGIMLEIFIKAKNIKETMVNYIENYINIQPTDSRKSVIRNSIYKRINIFK